MRRIELPAEILTEPVAQRTLDEGETPLDNKTDGETDRQEILLRHMCPCVRSALMTQIQWSPDLDKHVKLHP